MQNETTARPIVDILAELSGGRIVAIKNDTYVYLDTKEVVNSALVAEAESLQAKEQVPQKLTPRQARLLLLSHGLLDDIEALAQTDREIGIWWEYSLEIYRTNEKLLQAAELLNISNAMLDTMFAEGSVL